MVTPDGTRIPVERDNHSVFPTFAVSIFSEGQLEEQGYRFHTTESAQGLSKFMVTPAGAQVKLMTWRNLKMIYVRMAPMIPPPLPPTHTAPHFSYLPLDTLPNSQPGTDGGNYTAPAADEAAAPGELRSPLAGEHDPALAGEPADGSPPPGEPPDDEPPRRSRKRRTHLDMGSDIGASHRNWRDSTASSAVAGRVSGLALLPVMALALVASAGHEMSPLMPSLCSYAMPTVLSFAAEHAAHGLAASAVPRTTVYDPVDTELHAPDMRHLHEPRRQAPPPTYPGDHTIDGDMTLRQALQGPDRGK